MTKLSIALWCDLKTDEDRSAWLLLGRGVETGVIAPAIQADLAMAYHRLSLLQPRQPLTDENMYGLFKRSGLEAYHVRDSIVEREFDRCIERFARAIERAHGIGGEA